MTTILHPFSFESKISASIISVLSLLIFLNSIIGLISLLILLLIAINYLRLSEEKRLYKDFGDEYIDYKKKVSMIFPIKRLKS